MERRSGKWNFVYIPLQLGFCLHVNTTTVDGLRLFILLSRVFFDKIERPGPT